LADSQYELYSALVFWCFLNKNISFVLGHFDSIETKDYDIQPRLPFSSSFRSIRQRQKIVNCIEEATQLIDPSLIHTALMEIAGLVSELENEFTGLWQSSQCIYQSSRSQSFQSDNDEIRTVFSASKYHFDTIENGHVWLQRVSDLLILHGLVYDLLRNHEERFECKLKMMTDQVKQKIGYYGACVFGMFAILEEKVGQNDLATVPSAYILRLLAIWFPQCGDWVRGKLELMRICAGVVVPVSTELG